MDADRPLRRRLDRGLVGGVCAGLAEYLGLHPLIVRSAMLGLVAFSGIGLALYPLAWAVIPGQGRRPQEWRVRIHGVREAVAVAILTGAALIALRRIGLWLGDAVVWPVVLASCGLALILHQVGDPEWLQNRPRGADRGLRRAFREPKQVLRVAAPWRTGPAGVLGVVFIVGAAFAFLAGSGILRVSGRPLRESVVAVLALTLVVAPYLLGLARRVTAERAQRIRSEERAEMAAHLHDSVLQTLALIQRRAEDPAQVIGLARRQERELRQWLLDRDGDPTGSLAGALAQAAEEVEAAHAVRVEAVAVGDCPIDEHLEALVAAAREALVNAAKFSGVPQIDLYAEVSDEQVELFVRDRGVGFDPDRIPIDRQGIRRSILERMERHGGEAAVRSRPGEGAEIQLRLARVRA